MTLAHIETQVLLRSRGSAGPLFVLRWDMAESHMSDPFASRCDHHDLKHELVHKARHVRRNQLLFTKRGNSQDSLAQADHDNIAARNRLRHVPGFSAIARFGDPSHTFLPR